MVGVDVVDVARLASVVFDAKVRGNLVESRPAVFVDKGKLCQCNDVVERLYQGHMSRSHLQVPQSIQRISVQVERTLYTGDASPEKNAVFCIKNRVHARVCMVILSRKLQEIS